MPLRRKREGRGWRLTSDPVWGVVAREAESVGQTWTRILAPALPTR